MIKTQQPIQQDDKKSSYILPASLIASSISAVLVNPLDVLKIRQQKEHSHSCNVQNKSISLKGLVNHVQQQPQSHIEQIPSSKKWSNLFSFNKLQNKSQCAQSLTQSPQYNYSSSCVSVDNKSMLRGMAQIWRVEGLKTFFNGLRYSLFSSTTSTVAYFYFYERISQQIKKNITDHKVGLPLLSAAISRSITTTMTFPLEYWRTVSQAQIGSNKQGLKLGNRAFSSFSVTLQRDVIFSSIYWILAENIRQSLHGFWGIQPYSQVSNESKSHNLKQAKSLFTNAIAGSVAGGITALITLPLDVIKTKRQLYEKYTKDSSLKIMKDIIQQEGVRGLYAGIRPRIAKVVVVCSSMLTLYEYFLGICKKLY